MGMVLDTQVFGEPGEVRSLGEWLKATSSSVHEGGDVLYRVRGEAESVWNGPAGGAFREHLGRGGQDADDLTESVQAAGGAVVDFAAELETVQSQLTRARFVAANAGLTVTLTGIEEPGPGPVAPQNAGGSLAVISDHANAVAAYDRKVAAWTEVQAAVSDARDTERGAHETLARKINQHGTLWADIKQNRFFTTADALTGAAGGLHATRNKWNMRAPQLRAVATQAQGLMNNTTMSQAGRAEARRIMLARTAAADDAAKAAASNARLLGPLDDTARGQRMLGLMGRSVKGVPVIGTGITALQVGADIQGGKDVDRSIASGVAGLAAGALATNSTLLAVGAAGGPVTLGAVAVGIGASMVVGWAVDEYWDDIEDSSVGRAIGGAAEGTKDFLGKIF